MLPLQPTYLQTIFHLAYGHGTAATNGANRVVFYLTYHLYQRTSSSRFL